MAPKVGTEEQQPMEDVTETPYEVEEVILRKDYDTDFNYKHVYVWERVVIHVALQISWVIGFYMLLFHTKLATFLWAFGVGFMISESVALGAHRGYSHKSFKAALPLQIAFLLFQTMSGQNSMFTWVRDHKLHHKYSDTDADPHNASRGFFFSHMGWLMVYRHPLLLKKQKEVDISDLLGDKLVMFQYRYFLQIYFIVAVLIPVSVPIYFWNESFWSAFFVVYCFQYVTNLHLTWSINSFAHLWGNRPYDKRIKAVQSTFSWFVTMGEGWHNFHHAFPWDSRLSEFGQLGGLSTTVLDFLTYVGLAYDVKTASPKVVYGHMKRHGDEDGQKWIAQAEKQFTKMADTEENDEEDDIGSIIQTLIADR